MTKPHILFASSEVYPFAKTGGLADVSYSLPKAMLNEYQINVVMPLYRSIDQERYGIRALNQTFSITLGEHNFTIELFGCSLDGVEYTFVDSPIHYDREFLYGPPDMGYDDNALRFGLFNYAIVEMLKSHRYDGIHLNDWQCGLVPLLMDQEKIKTPKTLFTIHNLAYQGVFDPSCLNDLRIDNRYFSLDGIEFYGKVNFMKAAIAYADYITTVSPTYAKEILKPEFGCGLEGFLHSHRHKMKGIINGIDSEHFSPATDNELTHPYSTISGKNLNKKGYLKEVGLIGTQIPLIIFIGRFTWQKGMDLLIQILPKIASMQCNIALLGEGEENYIQAIREIADQYPNIHLHIGYDEPLSHRLYGAADFLLMPSLYEPCGLNQMIAMKYGVMPIVHHIGGLADTVKNVDKFERKNNIGYGVVFNRPSERAFSNAVHKAIALFEDKRRYNEIVKHNMECDFSWNNRAQYYQRLYASLSR